MPTANHVGPSIFSTAFMDRIRTRCSFYQRSEGVTKPHSCVRCEGDSRYCRECRGGGE